MAKRRKHKPTAEVPSGSSVAPLAEKSAAPVAPVAPPVSTLPIAPVVATLEDPGGKRFWYFHWSPDGRFLLTKAEGTNVLLWDTRTWRIVEVLPFEGIMGFVMGGNKIYTVKDGKRIAWDLDERRVVWEEDGPDVVSRKVGMVGISARGTVVLYQNWLVLDTATGEWIRKEPRIVHGGKVYERLPDGSFPLELRGAYPADREDILGITPDGRIAVTTPSIEGGHILRGRDVDTLDLVEELDVKRFAVSPRPDVLRRALRGGDLDEDELKKPGALFGLDTIQQTADGRFLVCWSYDGYEYIINIGTRPWRVHQVLSFYVLAWSPDHRFVCYKEIESPRVRIRLSALDSLAGTPVLDIERSDGEEIGQNAFSPDGRWFATILGNKVLIRAVDVDSSQIIHIA